MLKIQTFVNRRAFSCNVYVCSDENGSFIVDLGYFDSEIEAYLKTVAPVRFVLQTHGHFDHIMGLNTFSVKYPYVDIYCFKDETALAKDSNKNGSLMTGSPYIAECDFRPLSEGRGTLAGREIKVIHTPGHTAGSCMFYLENEKTVFTGDTLIESSIGRTDLPTGSEIEIFKSLEKIKAIKFSDDVEFYFGHGSPFKYSELVKYNSFMN